LIWTDSNIRAPHFEQIALTADFALDTTFAAVRGNLTARADLNF
jgi:hypothetical protein